MLNFLKSEKIPKIKIIKKKLEAGCHDALKIYEAPKLYVLKFYDLCPWFSIRKAIWYVPNCRIYKYNIKFSFFKQLSLPSSVGCLSFVLWNKIRNRLHEFSKIRQLDTYQIALLMRNQGHWLGTSVFPPERLDLFG